MASSGGTRISVNDLVRLIEDATGKNIKVNHAGFQKGDVRDTYADTSKARKMINYLPVVRIEQGVKMYVESIVG